MSSPTPTPTTPKKTLSFRDGNVTCNVVVSARIIEERGTRKVGTRTEAERTTMRERIGKGIEEYLVAVHIAKEQAGPRRAATPEEQNKFCYDMILLWHLGDERVTLLST